MPQNSLRIFHGMGLRDSRSMHGRMKVDLEVGGIERREDGFRVDVLPIIVSVTRSEAKSDCMLRV